MKIIQFHSYPKVNVITAFERKEKRELKQVPQRGDVFIAWASKTKMLKYCLFKILSFFLKTSGLKNNVC